MRFLVLLAALATPAFGTDRFEADCRVLAQHPHRLSGTDEARAATDYARDQLRRSGVDRVLVQSWPSTQTEVRRCEIVLDDAGPTLPLLPMRPNGIVPPVTSPEGVSGPLRHVRGGTAPDFGAVSPRGSIVVMDYDCGTAWMDALRRGARAIIFVADGEVRAGHHHYVEATTNLPRFFYEGSRSDLPEGAVVTIHSEVAWVPVTGRNVFGWIEGRDPVFHLKRDELMVVSAHLDSFGEVPRRSPGARAAANVAGLVEIARALARHRPRRHVLLALFDNQARCHTGSSRFYRLADPSVDLDRRARNIEREERFLEAVGTLASDADGFQRRDDVRPELFRRARVKAETRVHAINAALRAARRDVEDADAVSRLEQDKRHWNELRRALSHDWFAEQGRAVPAPVRERARAVLGEIQADVRLRRAEVAQERRGLDDDRALDGLLGDCWIGLHVSLALGDRTARWGLAIGGASGMHWARKDRPSAYLRAQEAILAAWRGLGGVDGPASSFAAATADGRLNPPNVLAYGAGIDKIHRSGFRKEPANLVHAGEVAGGLGIYNLALYTVQEDLRREGTPHDTVDRLDLDRLGRQFVEAGALLGAVADAPGLSQRSAIPSWYRTYQTEFRGDHRAHGLSVVGRRPGSTVSGAPMAGAIVQLYPFREQFRVRHFDFLEKKISAFDDFQVLRTDRNGTFEVGPVDQVADSNTWWSAHAFDDRGAVTHANTLACRTGNLLRIEMFRARGGRIICPPVPALKPGQILDAWTRSPLDPQRSYFQTADGVVFWYVPDTIGAVEVFGIDSVVALRAQGEGEGGAPAGRDVDGLERAARDLWTFNEERLAVLRERQVANDSVEQLHAAAEDLIRAGAGAESVSASGALAASAFMAQGRVYHKIRGTFDDLVLTVVILLSLTVPFAFALERLVIGASTIYRQIAGFIGIFALAFLIVMLTHPAFALAATPIVIFLGFSVVVLSAAVIVIIMRKFEVELKDLQGIATTVHAADVSRVGTVMAAMSMGISTMRRRPWRTALSMTTIILITFTILCFASFDTRIGVIRVPVVGPPGYAGVFVQRVGGRALEPDLYRVVRDRWAGAPGVIGVFARYGHASSDPTWPLVSRPDGSAPMAMQGLVGIEPGEMTQREDLAALLGASQAVSQDLVWMTHAVAERLGAVPGDPVLVSGEALRVGPILDAQRLTVATDMDGSTILPVDPGVGNDDLQDDAALSMRTQNWMAIPADQIIVVTAQVARRLGSALRSVSIYATDTGAATRIAEDAALMLPMPISATRRDGVHRHLLGTSLHTVGGFDLMVPLLMGALVIFATLLGSVADRQKEIYTFSALGLAPPHVAGLFFVEAMVYSIVGGLGGYIVALGVVKVLTPLGSIGPFRVPEMNHSSTNAVITLLIVMGTVLLSAIYPAVRASRSANPGILRQWQLPVPEGDRLDIVFPFTVSQWDAAGVVSFLREHFEQFADTGLGRFMARQVGLVRRDGAAPGLRARIALAPFDLGVTQQFELSTRASEIEGIDEVTIRIERTSGQPKDWRRLNRVLLDDIRRQFLIWRSLPQETMEVYRRRTLEDGV